MKKLFVVCAIVGLASSAVVASGKCDGIAFSQGFNENSVMLGKAGTALLSLAQPRHPGKWLVNNYDRRITIAIAEMDGEKCVRLKLDRKDCDTDFSFRSDRFPVRGGSGFRATFRVRGTFPMNDAQGQWGRGGTYIGWYDADGNRLATEFHFGLSFDDSAWHDVSVEGHIPDKAVEAFIELGSDAPNFKKDQTLCIANAKFAHVDAASVARVEIARPAPLMTDLAPGVEPMTKGLVTLRDDGMTLIDGKPFFPIGIYSVNRCAANSNNLEIAFRQLKDAGFNLVHTYDWKRGAEYTEYLDLAEKYGMKLLNNPSSPIEKRVLEERIRPNMLAWYLADDASKRTTPEKLREKSLTVKRYDNAHLTAQADSLGNAYKTRYADFIGSTDVFLPEIYTACGDHEIGHEVLFVDYQVKAVFRELAESGNQVKGVWPILQQFKGWKGWKRYPTQREIRAMSYVSIIDGAHGLTWYTYASARPAPGNFGAADDPKAWADLASVTRELSAIQDDLASRKAKRQPKATVASGPKHDIFGNASIHSILKEGANGPLLIAVNTAPEKLTAHFAVSDASRAEVLFEDRVIEAGDGFSDNFEPNAVHVYRLK